MTAPTQVPQQTEGPVHSKSPTSADMFSYRAVPSDGDLRPVAKEVFDIMKADGARFCRMTITGPDVQDDHSGYPAGLWFEGWLDPHPSPLPFGTALVEGGPICPPLAYTSASA